MNKFDYDKINSYEYMEYLLPELQKIDGNAINIKKVLKILSDIADASFAKELEYTNSMNVATAEGVLLDKFGGNFNAKRKTGESDAAFRADIRVSVAERKASTGIVALQGIADSITTGGRRAILKEKLVNGLPSVQIIGNANITEIKAIEEVLHGSLPAGISLETHVFNDGTWQDVKDKYPVWQDVKNNDNRW